MNEPGRRTATQRRQNDGIPHSLGRPRGLDHPPSVGAAPPRREDLNERNLRAEFGPCTIGRPKNQTSADRRPESERRKEIAMSVTTISPRQLAELCKGGKIDLIDVRTPVEYREVHVELARNVPLDRLDPAAVMQARNGSQGRAAVRHLSLGQPGPAGVREVPGGGLHERRQRRGRHAGLRAKPACRSSGARRRSRWSGRCASRPGRSCCWGRCSAGSSIRRSSACRRSSGPGWSSPGSPTPAGWG